MGTVSYYFNIAFPLKVTHAKDPVGNKWITKGIIVLRNKLRLLNNIKRSINLSMESLEYVRNYQLIFKKVTKEAKRREADRLILSAKNKNKAVWKLINKEIGNSLSEPNIIINTGGKIITNPQIITERFNTYFREVIDDLLAQVSYHYPQQYLNFQTKNCPETMFVAPVTVTKVEKAVKGLKIPTFLVKQCLSQFIKPLLHICNVSLETGTFPDMMKKAKIKPLFKKGDTRH
jgi:hypothetical protein